MRASLLVLLLLLSSLLPGCFGGASNSTPQPPKLPLEVKTTMYAPPPQWQGKSYWPIVFTKDDKYAHLRWQFLNNAEQQLKLLKLEKASSLEHAQVIVFLEYGAARDAGAAVLQGTQNLPQLQERLRGGKSIPPYEPRPLQGHFPATIVLHTNTAGSFVTVQCMALAPGKKGVLGETLWRSAATDTRTTGMASAFSRLLVSIKSRVADFDTWETKQTNAAPEDVWNSSNW